jgi:hypothetical protein
MIKALINEIKRHNDLREKELDLKILDKFAFHTKYGVWPKNEDINTQVVYYGTPQTHENHATSSMMKYTGQ